jgi:hypothetical protein
MATPLGTYSFLSYLRSGLANKISQPDQDPVMLRASFDVRLDIEGQAVNGGAPLVESVQKPVQLYAPGDIIGIEPQAIFKTDPLNWITNFESNYLPYIDFYEEDFPWRYTPSRPSGVRLRPWLALVVLEESEFTDGKNIQGKPLPFIDVPDAVNKFPPAAELWAWAHVHVNGDLAANEGQIVSSDMNEVLPKLASALNQSADVAYSRLLCPRKLKPNAAYHAFLLPSFETGRKAGLGLPVESAFASEYAWGTRPDQTSFPYYHRWFFRTGGLGDFEYLVRLLQAKPADERVGRRDMDVQAPGWGVPGIDPDGPLAGILRLGGALRVPEEVISDPEEFERYEHWADAGYPQPIQSAIARFVNLSSDYQDPGTSPVILPDPENPLDPDPLITPPLYGRWHAAVERLLTAADGAPLENTKNWVHELNLDPRFRVSAAFGTQVIQKHQEEYMNLAWQQVGDLSNVNRLIRFAQLASETLWQWHTRQIQSLASTDPERLILFSAPVQRRIVIQNATVAHQLKRSVVPPVVVSAQMRRVLRPRGRALARIGGASAASLHRGVIRRLNSGELVASPIKATPSALLNGTTLANAIAPEPRGLVKLVRDYPGLPALVLVLAILVLLLALLVAFLLSTPLLVAAGLALAGALLALYVRMLRIQRAPAVPPLFGDTVGPEVVDQAPKSPDFRLTTPDERFTATSGATDSVEAQRFKSALKDAFAVDVAARAAAELPPKLTLDLPGLARGMAAELHPDRTLPRLVLERIRLPERLRARFDPAAFDEILDYPKFDLPMYVPLVDLSKEYFLPNIGLIEPNSITLLETNQKFIESYLVGLNHEMARELLWREYPTDQRGSYFRQFWDVSAYLPEDDADADELKEALKDIPEVHTWPLTSALGDHDHRETGGDKEEEVVLVIRGELLKKYPNAVIYAHKARWQMKKNPDGSDGTQIDNTKERDLAVVPVGQENKPPRSIVKTPLYSAKVEPDIYFFGFDLTAEEAKGTDGSHPGDENQPGWFFVIKERPGEPRFGLDLGPANAHKHTWADLAWEDAAPGLEEGGFLQIGAGPASIDLERPTDTTQAEFDEEVEQYEDDRKVFWRKEVDAAELAYVLYQAPMMVAVHASEMLTPKAS